MVSRKDLLTFQFYKKEKFTGSDRSMRYLIRKETEDGGDVFAVYTWHGPYNFASTKEELKVRKTFPFIAESLDLAVDYLNEAYDFIEKQGDVGL